MQVDWGECGSVPVGTTTRKVSVFVAVLCYSRLIFIEFTLSQHKAEFYRCLVHALEFFGGSPRALIVDYVPGHIIDVMCPTWLCGRGVPSGLIGRADLVSSAT